MTLGGSVVKNLPYNAGDNIGNVSLISGSGMSSGEGNGNPLQCSYLGRGMPFLKRNEYFLT